VHISADVLADLDVLDFAALDALQQPAGLFGALGRVLRQVARALPARLLLRRELLDVELVAPADLASAELGGDLDLDRRDGFSQGLLEQLAREPPVRRAQLAVAVVGHPPVEADDGVQVHQAAALVLRHLHVGHLHQLTQALLRHPGEGGELAREVDRGVAPQLAEQVVPDHRALIIEALRAQRLTETRIIQAVHA